MNSTDTLIEQVQGGEIVAAEAKRQMEIQLKVSVTMLSVAVLAHERDNLIELLSDHGNAGKLSETQAMMIWQFARLGITVATGASVTMVLETDKVALKARVQDQ